jgi:hypothetical protein
MSRSLAIVALEIVRFSAAVANASIDSAAKTARQVHHLPSSTTKMATSYTFF